MIQQTSVPSSLEGKISNISNPEIQVYFVWISGFKIIKEVGRSKAGSLN